MGHAKTTYIEHLEEVESAKQLLVDRGLLNYCDRHDTVHGDGSGPDEEELLAAAAHFQSSENDALNVLREAVEDSGDECGWCSKEDLS